MQKDYLKIESKDYDMEISLILIFNFYLRNLWIFHLALDIIRFSEYNIDVIYLFGGVII